MNEILNAEIPILMVNDHLMPLFEALFPPTSPEPSPSSIKAMLNIAGLGEDVLRLPLVRVPENYRGTLQELLVGYGLVESAF